MKDLKNIIESILFVSNTPISIGNLKNILNPADTGNIKGALDSLINEYNTRQGGFELRRVAGGYQFCTRAEYTPWIKRFIQPPAANLSKAALETLAIIAYKQPVIRSDVEYIRGVECGGIIRLLLKRNLIRVLGRKEIPGRPLIYATTKLFLEVFDLNNLQDLPTPIEIQDIIPDEPDERNKPNDKFDHQKELDKSLNEHNLTKTQKNLDLKPK